MTQVRERFTGKPMGVNGQFLGAGLFLGGFLAATSGTITVTGKDSAGTGTVTIVNAVPVTAGFFTPIPLVFESAGFTVQLAGGASGTLMV